MSDASTPRSRALPAAGLAMLGLVTLALNLRPAAVSTGPVLAEVTGALHMGPATAGVLTSLPVLAFAGIGAIAPALAMRVGVHRITLIALLCVLLGLAARAVIDDALLFLVLTFIALSGMATANVLLPSLVKLHFPDRTGTVTAIYTTALAIGLTCSLMLTVPIAEALGSWRWGLGIWAILAGLSALPWLGLVAHDATGRQRPHLISLSDVARTRLGWAMALFFGIQSAQAYSFFGWFPQLWRDAGYSPTTAGLLIGLLAGVSVPLSLWLPAAATRMHNQRTLMLAVIGCYPFGFAMLLWKPYALAVPAAILVGIGGCTFTLVLTLIGLRSATPAGTAALSGFTQSVGYLLAAAGPFAVGLVYEATGGWTVPLLLLAVLTVPLAGLAIYASGPILIEDQLPAR